MRKILNKSPNQIAKAEKRKSQIIATNKKTVQQYLERRLTDYTNSTHSDREKLRVELEQKIEVVSQKVDTIKEKLGKTVSKSLALTLLSIAATIFVALFVYSLADHSKVKDDIHSVDTRLEGIRVKQELYEKELDAVSSEIREVMSREETNAKTEAADKEGK